MFDVTQFVRTVGETSARLILNTTLKNIEVMMMDQEDIDIALTQVIAYEFYFETIDALNKGIAAGVSQSESEK